MTNPFPGEPVSVLGPAAANSSSLYPYYIYSVDASTGESSVELIDESLFVPLGDGFQLINAKFTGISDFGAVVGHATYEKQQKGNKPTLYETETVVDDGESFDVYYGPAFEGGPPLEVNVSAATTLNTRVMP